jgi:hypothetical protein
MFQTKVVASPFSPGTKKVSWGKSCQGVVRAEHTDFAVLVVHHADLTTCDDYYLCMLTIMMRCSSFCV